MAQLKDDIKLVLMALEEAGLHHRKNFGRMAEIVIRILGIRQLNQFFGTATKQQCYQETEYYIYNHLY